MHAVSDAPLGRTDAIVKDRTGIVSRSAGSDPARRVGNLPADLTRLVGRRTEAAAVKRLLAESRLVTVTGVGGVGKTRLAVHVARQVHAAYSGGVCFVPLAALTQPELVAHSISAALPPAAAAGADVFDLVGRIGQRELLLVLDNCEHLVDSCAEVVGQILRSCPHVHVLATSRERLRADGEAVFVVPPLSVPTTAGAPGVTAMAAQAGGLHTGGESRRSDAVTLFLERAAANKPDLVLTDDDRRTIDALVSRLDGLPLAIELVAGRVGAVSIAALAGRLDDRFELLTNGFRTAPRRHQTLRATVDYSYELCSDTARLLWARLAVFAGSGTLDAIVAVCSDERLSSGEVGQALGELVDKSVVAFDGSRYRLLSTLREYGLERLDEFGDGRNTRIAHCDHFLAGAAAATLASGAHQRTQLEALLGDEANLYGALQLCCSDPERAELGLAVAGSLWPFWVRCGRAHQGRYWLDLLLGIDTRPTRARVHALWVSGQLAVHRGDMATGLKFATECERLALELDDRTGLAHARYVRGSANLHLDRLPEAISDLQDAVELEGEPDGETPILVMSLYLLGAAMCCDGDREHAMAVLEQARTLSETHDDAVSLNASMLWLGLARLLNGAINDATELLSQVLVQGRVIEDLLVMSTAVEFLAWGAQLQGQSKRAARLMGLSQALADPLGVHLAGFRGLRAWHEMYAESARSALGSAEFQAGFDAGHGGDMDSAIELVRTGRSTEPAELPGVSDAGSLTEQSTTPLTRRELEIAGLVAVGKTNKQIAAGLVISPRTVETHVEHILAKLEFTSRHQLMALFASRAAHAADATPETSGSWAIR